MSSEWNVGGGNEHDMYRQMWDDVGDDWAFDALNEEDWYVDFLN